MRKELELTDPRSCLNKAADDEPLFVLRAQDATAPLSIEHWLAMNPQLPMEKRREAIECMEAMRAWPTQKKPD